jgi:pimeloyl-ACP methyl ester carboxylesterase
MELFYRKLGTGKPLIILHGLYGSSDNWYTIGKQLSSHFEIFLPDLRNHGHSPHHPDHSYIALRDDLHEFIVAHSIFRPVLLGHSMGGRTAMFFAASHPHLIDRLIVADISPCSYQADQHPNERLQHSDIIRSLLSLDISGIKSRSDADKALAGAIPSQAIRQFLLKNLKVRDHNRYFWGLNLPALEENLPGIFRGIDTLGLPEGKPMSFPALFVRGERSGYISESDLPCIEKYFRAARIVTIPGAGHWLHAEQPALFLKAVKEFLDIPSA